ncbi:MAG: dihydrodipicolinate synthase family protein, partial [Paraclostridium sp.]
SIPFLTGVNMSLDQFAELFENEKIIGVKFTAADFYLLERMRKRFPDKLIYAGFDEMMLPAVVLGVDGAIGSTFNVNGVRAKQIFELAKNNKIEEAREIQHITNDLITDILGNGLYQTIKLILEEQGVEAGYCRQPMKEATEEMKQKAKEMYNKYFVKELDKVNA